MWDRQAVKEVPRLESRPGPEGKYLPYKFRAQIPLKNQGVMVHSFKSSSRELETGRPLGLTGQPASPMGEFQVPLRPVLRLT